MPTLAASALVTSSSSAVKDDSIRISPCSALWLTGCGSTCGAACRRCSTTACEGPSTVRGSIAHPQHTVQSPLHVFPTHVKLPLRLEVCCGFESGIEQQPTSLQQTCSCYTIVASQLQACTGPSNITQDTSSTPARRSVASPGMAPAWHQAFTQQALPHHELVGSGSFDAASTYGVKQCNAPTGFAQAYTPCLCRRVAYLRLRKRSSAEASAPKLAAGTWADLVRVVLDQVQIRCRDDIDGQRHDGQRASQISQVRARMPLISRSVTASCTRNALCQMGCIDSGDTVLRNLPELAEKAAFRRAICD